VLAALSLVRIKQASSDLLLRHAHIPAAVCKHTERGRCTHTHIVSRTRTPA
jgi:hypothetical protein